MKTAKKALALLLAVALGLFFNACSESGTTDNTDGTSTAPTATEQNTEPSTAQEVNPVNINDTADYAKLLLDTAAWNYDADNDVYWQIGVVYCSDPAATEYESMGIYVPGAYMTATENGDGTYTCSVETAGSVGGYTAETAPMVIPVNTAGYSAQSAPTSYNYNEASSYLSAGFVYVNAGCRGRSNGYDASGNLTYAGGAPWGVTDLKAAVRYLRYNNSEIPGSTDSIFTFGHSGGGAQSSLMGATGDSELFYDYLTSIGAAMYGKNGEYISDAIAGAMCWCPITSLDYANEAYEWMMGQYSANGTRADGTWTSALSDDLAAAFAEYINALELTDENGAVLTLSDSENGIYTEGSYYEYLLSEIERSLNNFLSDTEFPYTSGDSSGMSGGGPGGGMPSGDTPGGEMPSGNAPTDDKPSGEAPGGNMLSGDTSESESSGTTYETAQDYINSLNSESEWITYDAATNTASIISVEVFVAKCKNASKSVGAFDDLNRSQAENILFGDSNADALHFDSIMAALLLANQEAYATYTDWDSTYAEAYQEYLESIDDLGNSSLYRQNMYNPMYYLSEYYEGYGTSNVAKYWRIHSGINQGDTALTVGMNLALALEQYDGVESVDFEMVWAQGHTAAERTGNSTDNFIAWVNECCP